MTNKTICVMIARATDRTTVTKKLSEAEHYIIIVKLHQGRLIDYSMELYNNHIVRVLHMHG